MEVTNTDDLTQKLILVLKKTAECKKFDSIFTEKFLVCITREFSNIYENIIHAPEFSEWVSETIQKWKQTNPNVAEAIFICKFIGLLTKNKEGLQFILNSPVLTELINILQSNAFEQTALTPVYICFLSDILTHTIGYEWVKNTKQWKTVSELYFFNSNLYVEREGLNFLKTFISKVVLDDKESKEILQEIFLPLSTYNEINIEDQKFISVTVLYLNLIQLLLEGQIFSQNSSFLIKLGEIFDLQLFLNFLFENCKEDTVLEKASILQVISFVFQCEDKKDLKNLSGIIDYYFVMLNKNLFNGIVNLAKYCQVLWSKIRKEIKCENETAAHYIIMQLLPALMCTKPDTSSYDVYIEKLFSLQTTPRAQKFFDLFYVEIRSKINSNPKNLALKSILSVVSNIECLNSEEVLIIFRTMAYILNTFVTDKSCQSESININELEISLKVQDTAILSAVLNAMCVLFEKFKVRWSEALECLCLFKMTCNLLEHPNLPPVVIVKIFLLVKLAILNCTPSDLPLSPNNMENSTFDWLISLLLKRLHDPNWEIRDSCLEVVTAIAEISDSKYPAFEQLLVEKNLCSLVFDIMEGDSESYVRASAIQALTALIKIEPLNQFLTRKDVSHKIIQLLQTESEAIVRREAALMIKQLYLALSDSSDEIATSFYEVMGYSAISDLHWEVKVNSLIFWEAVIQRISANYDMVNSYVPNIELSKEESIVKSRLNKFLNKLSEIGCLYVLLSTLNDDCDMPVIRKSAQILSELMAILERNGVNEFFNDIPVGDRIPVKRKSSISDSFEKKKTPNLIVRNSGDSLGEINSKSLQNEKFASSDVVIDEIVNEMDINLLGVCFQKDLTVNLQTKILLQRVKPETFLSQMQNFNFEKFLEEKQNWLINVEVDLKSLLLETCAVNLTDETNVMDCY